jgi:hypothetical protein
MSLLVRRAALLEEGVDPNGLAHSFLPCDPLIDEEPAVQLWSLSRWGDQLVFLHLNAL